jgi:hypothetical protein
MFIELVLYRDHFRRKEKHSIMLQADPINASLCKAEKMDKFYPFRF